MAVQVARKAVRSTPTLYCPSCMQPREMTTTRCRACGWDVAKEERYCACGGPFVIDSGSGFSFGNFAGIGGVGAVLLVKFLGAGIVLCAAAGLASLGGFLSSLTMRYRCGMCHEDAPRKVLSREERRRFAKMKATYLSGAIAFGVVSLLMAWLVVWAHREVMRSTSTRPSSVTVAMTGR